MNAGIDTPTGTSFPPPRVEPPHDQPPQPPIVPPPLMVPGPSQYPPRRRGRGLVWITLGSVALVALVGTMIIGVVGDSGDESTGTVPGLTVAEPAAEEPGGVATPSTSPSATAAPTYAPDVPLQGPVDVLSSFAFTEVLGVAWEGGGMTMQLNGAFVNGDQVCNVTMSYAGNVMVFGVVTIGSTAWYDDGSGSWSQRSLDDYDVSTLLDACPTSHTMWGEDFSAAPTGGTPAVIDGMEVVQYDVTTSPDDWSVLFGLPEGFTALSMEVWTSADGTWVGGMEATLSASADSMRWFMGLPPEDVTSDCTMMMSLHITNPNDPTLSITPPA